MSVIAHDDGSFPMIPTPLEIQDLTCRYGDRLALDRLSLILNAGEILGIAGAPGAGISTLIKAILMLVAPQAGRVLIFAKPHELASNRNLIAYLPETIQPPGHLTGYDVINMARTVHGEAAATPSIDELAADLDLPLSLLAHPTRRYARDDIQKLGLVTLLSMERPLLILDQPMAHIGPATRKGLLSHLTNHAAKGGAVLLGSHNVDDHRNIADRLLVLKDGQLQGGSSFQRVQTRRDEPGLITPADPRTPDAVLPPLVAQRPSG